MSHKVWFVGAIGLVALVACESSDDGDSPGGHAGRGGSSGASGAAGSSGKAGSANAGSSSGGAPGTGGSAGAAGNAANGGSPRGEAGESSGGAAAGAPSGDGGTGEGGVGGDGGNDDGAPAVAYISTLLRKLLVASLDPVTGAPSLLPSSPIELDSFVNGVAVSPNRRFVFVPVEPARIDTFPIQADGSLPEEPTSSVEVEDDSAILSLALDPLGRFAYGVIPFSQAIHVFKVDATTGALTPSGEPLVVGPEPGHRRPAFLAPDPSGRFVYVTQLNDGAPAADNGIRIYGVDPTSGELTELESSPVNAGNVTAGAIVFRPDGKFLFSAGGGVNAFAIDQETGALDLVEGSPFSQDVQSDPWAPNITMDPRGKRLYVSNFVQTQNITGFDIDATTGALQKLPGEPVKTAAPYSIALGPGGRFLYVGDDTSELSVFSVSSATGALTKLAGSPFAFGGLEADIAFVTLP
ncbi:MAG: hypothetical protein K0R38_967 [Polyangiaceae bacterium]|jgi:6-phosphogluconolactonase (cycloisomerase 2 family)|nr:hypothetical protein [Polyangiaceae bacterium]